MRGCSSIFALTPVAYINLRYMGDDSHAHKPYADCKKTIHICVIGLACRLKPLIHRLAPWITFPIANATISEEYEP